jgi:hypothetical protein
MTGAWLWADHIQAIRSQSRILQSTKLLGQLKKKLLMDEFLADEKSMFVR